MRDFNQENISFTFCDLLKYLAQVSTSKIVCRRPVHVLVLRGCVGWPASLLLSNHMKGVRGSSCQEGN